MIETLIGIVLGAVLTGVLGVIATYVILDVLEAWDK